MGHKPFQELRDKMTDHKEIWLEPRPIPPADQDNRTWCEDNVYEIDDHDGREATRYIRADLHDTIENQLLTQLTADTKTIIELDERRDELLVVVADKDREIAALKQTIRKAQELPEKWRYHGDGECNCLTCVCANELQAILNRSKS